MKSESPFAVKEQSKIMNPQAHMLQSNQELKQLWTACYFDRKLTKPQIQVMDLLHSIQILQRMVKESAVDFRIVPPLVLGLTKLF